MFGKSGAKTGMSETPMFGRPMDFGSMYGQLQNPYAMPMKPLPENAQGLAGTPWGNFMQSPNSFGRGFDNMQAMPWLMGQYDMARQKQGGYAPANYGKTPKA